MKVKALKGKLSMIVNLDEPTLRYLDSCNRWLSQMYGGELSEPVIIRRAVRELFLQLIKLLYMQNMKPIEQRKAEAKEIIARETVAIHEAANGWPIPNTTDDLVNY